MSYVRAHTLLAIVMVAACSEGQIEEPVSEPEPIDKPPEEVIEEVKEMPYDTLSEYALVVGNGATQQPASGVIPYEPISPLFSDFSTKYRFLYVPEGKKIGYQNEAKWDFPDGSILVKTFAYLANLNEPAGERRLIETRLMLKDAEGWTPHTYLWNDEQTEATRKREGARVEVSWLDALGEMREITYRVPNTNQCLGCHGDTGVTEQLGPRTRQLNKEYAYVDGSENQIDKLHALGLFDVAPPDITERISLTSPSGDEDITWRARSYLDANCSHCHNPSIGVATNSGVHVNFETDNPIDYGVCRSPVAAGPGSGGFEFDIVPGNPEESIMVFRVGSEDPGIKMPEIGTLHDPIGVEVLTEWIAGMEPRNCHGDDEDEVEPPDSDNEEADDSEGGNPE